MITIPFAISVRCVLAVLGIFGIEQIPLLLTGLAALPETLAEWLLLALPFFRDQFSNSKTRDVVGLVGES